MVCTSLRFAQSVAISETLSGANAENVSVPKFRAVLAEGKTEARGG